MAGDLLTTTNTFNNPFEEINANVIDSKRIVDYWCNPFDLGLTNSDERKFRTSKIPIILQGSRGSGKTTILKYYSFPAQLERAENQRDKSLKRLIKNEEEVGFYFRCEESFVSTFELIFKNVNSEQWTRIFECYIELVFAEQLIEMLRSLQVRQEIEAISSSSIQDIFIKTGISNVDECGSIKELYSLVHKNVAYFEQYKNRIVFTEERFEPPFFVGIFSLSIAIIQEIKKIIPDFSNVLFILMIDEYENLSSELQKRFNTIIKFAKPDVSIRIGRRSEGAFTTETVNDVEYLRENHDYYLASLGREPDITKMKKYFLEVSNRRFQKAGILWTDIKDYSIEKMLGDMEDLQKECREVCGSRKNHLDAILKQSPQLASNEKLREFIIDIIKNDTNPIAETINALWVIRNKKYDVKDAAKYAVTAMNAYFAGEKKEGVKKYKADYSNKYRYAITVFICSVYKRDKLYYGFNAVSHLSNGNVRTFINFCQSIINEALFYEKDRFLKSGTISRNIQSDAIRKFSKSEFDSICSVVYAGDKIKRLISNLGNSFSIYHKDRRLRYPETTQFAFDEAQLHPQDRDVLRTAESWAIIIRRDREQRISAGVYERTELCHMNKMFAPLFNISYRTRGGVNLYLNKNEIQSLLYIDSFYPDSVKKLIHGQDIEQIIASEENKQMSLFDLGMTYNE